MAFTNDQIEEIENAAAKFMYYNRPPLEVRLQLDLGYRIDDQNVYLFEIRPKWNNPTESMESLVAKTTYVKSKNIWKVFWMRSDLKWHNYKPVPTVATINNFFDLVEEDELSCFFG